jgi:hypothetical protein
MTTQTTKPDPTRAEQRHEAATSSGSAAPAGAPSHSHSGHRADALEDYAGGYIQARHGKVNAWLVVVIVVLIVWAIYYGFTHWGGLGEGLDY